MVHKPEELRRLAVGKYKAAELVTTPEEAIEEVWDKVSFERIYLRSNSDGIIE